jgi:hypothetical protein
VQGRVYSVYSADRHRSPLKRNARSSRRRVPRVGADGVCEWTGRWHGRDAKASPHHESSYVCTMYTVWSGRWCVSRGLWRLRTERTRVAGQIRQHAAGSTSSACSDDSSASAVITIGSPPVRVALRVRVAPHASCVACRTSDAARFDSRRAASRRDSRRAASIELCVAHCILRCALLSIAFTSADGLRTAAPRRTSVPEGPLSAAQALISPPQNASRNGGDVVARGEPSPGSGGRRQACVRAHARARRTTMVVARSGHADGVTEAEERLDVRERHRQHRWSVARAWQHAACTIPGTA